MKLRILPILLLLTIPIIWNGCKPNEDPIEPQLDQFHYYFNYSNPGGVSPSVDFEPLTGGISSPEVNIDLGSISEVASGTNNVDVVFNNVSIFRENDNGDKVIYKIDDLKVEFYQNGMWLLDSEFNYFVSSLTNLDVAIVLDASNSLSDDFPQIQSFVNEFVGNLFRDIPDVGVGVIDFSTYHNTFPITDQQALIQAYIDGIKLDQYTRLYGAMDQGISLLENSLGTSKAMLTFTDGVDNQSTPANNVTHLTNRLANNPNIASYTIGLGNIIDKVALESLTANGGIAEFPANMADLQQSFTNFSKNITTLHSLTYQRNAQEIPVQNKVPLRFVISASPK